jgi:TRAP-type C4-dicarboxylate transport system permease small subunit
MKMTGNPIVDSLFLIACGLLVYASWTWKKKELS